MTNAAISSPHDARTAELAQRFASWRAQNPRGYLRNAASALGVSELELLVATGGSDVQALRTDDIPGLLGAIAAWGELRTMTRNDHAVLEQTGHYDNLAFFGPAMGQTVGSIDMRIFARHWVHAYGVVTPGKSAPRCSVQFFDAHGVNIHKVFAGDPTAYRSLCGQWAVHNPLPGLPAVEPAIPETPRPDSEVDVAELHRRWDALEDTHDFIGLLRRCDVTRTQALRLAGESRAIPVTAEALQLTLQQAADAAENVMIFVGNRGLVQIYIGQIQRVVATSGWLNILDPKVDLHVRDGSISDAWLVTKPTRHGPVRSLECYGSGGETVLQVFGKRTETDSTPPGMNAIFDSVLQHCRAG